MPFGSIDWRQLDRTAQSLQNFSDKALRNDQAKLQVEQDNADRGIAEQASKEFFESISPPKEQRGFGEQSKGTQGIGGTGSAQPSTQATPYAPDFEKMFQAAAKAGETLAKGGGRHSQAAAQRIHQYLDDLVKIHAYRQASAPGPLTEYVPGESIGKGRESRRVGNRILEKHYEVDKRNNNHPTGNWKWQEMGVEPEGAGNREKSALDKLNKEFLENNQVVRDTEERHGGNTAYAKELTDLQKDPEVAPVLSMTPAQVEDYLAEMAAQGQEKAAKANKIKEMVAYHKALSTKTARLKQLNGKGFLPDEDSGELVPTNPKMMKKKKEEPAQGESGVTHDYVPGKGLVPRASK